MRGTRPTRLVGKMSTVAVSPKSGHRQSCGWEVVAAPACAIRRAGLLSCLLLSFFFISAAAAAAEGVEDDGLGASEGLKETADATALEKGNGKALDPDHVALLRDQLKALKDDEDAQALVLQSVLKAREKQLRKNAATAGIAGGVGTVAAALSILGSSKLGAKDDASMPKRSSGTASRSARSLLRTSLTGVGFGAALLAVLGFATAMKYGFEALGHKKETPGMVKNFREAIAQRRQELEKTKLGKLPEEVSATIAEEASRTSS